MKFRHFDKSNQSEHAHFASTLSKGRNFTKNSFDIVAKNGYNVEATFDVVDKIIRHVAYDNVASTLLLV